MRGSIDVDALVNKNVKLGGLPVIVVYPLNDYDLRALATLTGMTPTEVKDRYAPNFCQIWPKRAGEYVYLYGIEGGRFGGVKLGRVKTENFENFDEYEYLTEV